MRRKTLRMTDLEWGRFNRVGRKEGDAWQFWNDLGRIHRFDPRTVIMLDAWVNEYTALDVSADEADWCWPLPLKCTTDPATVEY